MELHTDGLVLRPWRLDDAPAVTAACQDPEIARWLPVIPTPYEEEHARAFLEQTARSRENGESYGFAVLDAESGALLGSIAIGLLPFHCGRIGYWVAREARGRGVATTALKALCRWAVDELELKRLDLLTDPDNLASQRVAEKAGFQREGIMRSSLEYQDGRRRDSVLFSLLPDELRGP
jgi:RimJ/RimL family protein N-acetyltransferase